MLCHAILAYAVPCCAVPCHAMLCYAMLCYAMLCHAMLCYAMLCYAMRHPAATPLWSSASRPPLLEDMWLFWSLAEKDEKVGLAYASSQLHTHNFESVALHRA